MRAWWYCPEAARDLGLPPSAGQEGIELSLDAAQALCRWLRQRRPLLQEIPVADLLELLGRVSGKWSTSSGTPNLKPAVAELAARTGYPEEVLERVLTHFFTTHSSSGLWQLMASNRLLPGDLDGRTASSDQRSIAHGPALTLILAAGNVPVAPLPSVYHALMVKSPCLVRTPGEDPGLVPRLAQSLWETAPVLGACLATLSWESRSAEVTAALADEAEAVIAQGSDETIAALRALCPPRARFIGHGHRLGFGIIGREFLSRDEAPETALLAATDVAWFDQQGCVSPQWFYVEAGGEVPPVEFASGLAEALEAAQRRWPRRALSVAETSAIHQARAVWQVRAEARVWTSAGTEWTVIYTPDPSPEASCLNRLVFVKPVADVVDALPDLGAVTPYLQTVACAVGASRRARLAAHLGPLGVTRLCALGRTQFLPPAHHHDGREALRELLRWIQVEESQGSPRR
jgi:hypothetical protein